MTIDPALGAPGPDLVYVFISAPGLEQGDTQVLVDDIYLSPGDFNATVPVPAGSFTPATGPTEIVVSSSNYDPATGHFGLTWGSLAGFSYTIQGKSKLDGAWESVASGYPAGGAAGTTTTWSIDVSGQDGGFYRVVYP